MNNYFQIFRTTNYLIKYPLHFFQTQNFGANDPLFFGCYLYKIFLILKFKKSIDILINANSPFRIE